MPMIARARRLPLAVAALAPLLWCAACSKPEPPETDRPPEPQAAAPAAAATAAPAVANQGPQKQ